LPLLQLTHFSNNKIRDLLRPTGKHLDLREDPVCGTQVAGVLSVPAASVRHVMGLVEAGNGQRTEAATSANPVSSRSHAVLQLVVEQAAPEGAAAAAPSRRRGTKASKLRPNVGQKCVLVSKLSLIDLAGSERAAHTQVRRPRLLLLLLFTRFLFKSSPRSHPPPHRTAAPGCGKARPSTGRSWRWPTASARW